MHTYNWTLYTNSGETTVVFEKRLLLDFFKGSAQVITAQACGISHRTVKRICAEARKSDDPETPDASLTFISPRKGYKRAKTVSELDDFDSDIVRRTVYEFYDRGCARYGFIEGSKLVFRSNSGNTMDYHDQMNGEVFKQWFIQLLNNLEEPSVIVMDNAPYHSTLKETYPKSNWRKAGVQQWLTDKNVEFHPLETLPELRQKVKYLMPREKKYEPDEIALEKGEGRSGEKNYTFKMVDIKRLTHDALDAVTVDDWKKCVHHAEEIQIEDNKKEIMRDTMIEPIILTILPDDSDWSDDDDQDDDEGNRE
ncbi:hypothetical protein QTP88_001211 [Uroleucon formosanum]